MSVPNLTSQNPPSGRSLAGSKCPLAIFRFAAPVVGSPFFLSFSSLSDHSEQNGIEQSIASHIPSIKQARTREKLSSVLFPASKSPAMHPAAVLALESSSLPTAAPAVATRKAVRFINRQERDHFDSPITTDESASSSDDAASFSDASLDDELDAPEEYAPGVLRDETSWAGNLPAAQGLVRSFAHRRHLEQLLMLLSFIVRPRE